MDTSPHLAKNLLKIVRKQWQSDFGRLTEDAACEPSMIASVATLVCATSVKKAEVGKSAGRQTKGCPSDISCG